MKYMIRFFEVVFLSLLMTTSLFAANQGPQLKFDEKSIAEEKGTSDNSKKEFIYGAEPIAKFGNDRNYFKLGAYASMRFEHDSASGIADTFTFRRFVLETDAKIASRFRIYSEIEFERFRKIELERDVTAQNGGLKVTQEIEGTNQSEIAIEQAWFELAFADWIRFQGGGVLIPVGRFNINHDDNLWNFPRRSLVDRGVPVLPTTAAWDELGLGLNGDVEVGEKSKLNYKVYVVNGVVLDAELEEVVQTRSPKRDKLELEAEFGISTGTFSQDIKNAKAVTGRLMYSPLLGHEFGFSGYWGRYTPEYLVGKNLTAVGVDTLQVFGNFDVEAEYVLSYFSGLKDVMSSFANAVGEGEVAVKSADSPDLESEIAFAPSRLVELKQGYWLELRYHWRPQWLTKSWFGKYFSDPHLIPLLRWEQAFLNGRITDATISGGQLTEYVTQNNQVDRLAVGLAFRLNPLAVFQLAYEYTQVNNGTPLAEVVNYLPTLSSQNNAVMFGAAFGF